MVSFAAGHPIVEEHEAQSAPLPSPVSLLASSSCPMGPGPPILILLSMLRRVLSRLPVSDSRAQPGMGISAFPVPEIDTGGERQMFQPT